MKTSMSLVLQPPPFKVKGGRFDEAGKAWWSEVEIQTPKGVATVFVKVTLPEAVKVLYSEFMPRLMAMAAERVIASKGAEDFGIEAGAFGVSLPNPKKVVKRGAQRLNSAAKTVANRAVANVPKQFQKAVAAPLIKIAKAKNATELVQAVSEASATIGPNIPGTSIPLSTLHPYGAAVAFGTQVLGKEGTREVLEQVAEVVDEAIASGAIKKTGKTVAVQKAKATGKTLSKNALFAKEVGIPTLDIHPDLHDAGRAMIGILRGVYLGNPEAVGKLKKLSDAAAKGDKNARILWALGAQISEAARGKGKAQYSAGDGYGEGYGQAGYVPPAPPMLAYR